MDRGSKINDSPSQVLPFPFFLIEFRILAQKPFNAPFHARKQGS